ncbi:MAG: isoprenylcysteine carboxylmethyltransferase family protein [Candidatus Lokiarchaeota archaeon]|nr:isoprenylcysteine carboxylmethyltransferase family protein [Candidatus Lokiarchaeota archaeon]
MLLNAKSIVKVGIFLLFIASSLFIPAGTIFWIEAWIYLIIWGIFIFIVLYYLNKKNPELLKKRLENPKPKQKWDKIIVLILFILMIPSFVIPGLDVIRFQWSYLPIFIRIIGFIGVIISSIIYLLVLRENTYLIKSIEVQEEHKVIISGPYKYVRHPMYTGIIIFLICHCLALGSLYTLIPAGLFIITFILRTYFEDKMLENDLEGYKEYMKKTHYRLIPYIW